MRHSVVPSAPYIFPFLYTLYSLKDLNMSITFDVFRGSPEGRVIADTVTKTLEHNESLSRPWLLAYAERTSIS